MAVTSVRPSIHPSIHPCVRACACRARRPREKSVRQTAPPSTGSIDSCSAASTTTRVRPFVHFPSSSSLQPLIQVYIIITVLFPVPGAVEPPDRRTSHARERVTDWDNQRSELLEQRRRQVPPPRSLMVASLNTPPPPPLHLRALLFGFARPLPLQARAPQSTVVSARRLGPSRRLDLTSAGSDRRPAAAATASTPVPDSLSPRPSPCRVADRLRICRTAPAPNVRPLLVFSGLAPLLDLLGAAARPCDVITATGLLSALSAPLSSPPTCESRPNLTRRTPQGLGVLFSAVYFTPHRAVSPRASLTLLLLARPETKRPRFASAKPGALCQPYPRSVGQEGWTGSLPLCTPSCNHAAFETRSPLAGLDKSPAMGNQTSKEGVSSKGSASASDGHFQSYPSFGRSETRDSSRSFRSLRSKIPGGGGSGFKTDSPRGSAVLSASDLAAADKPIDAASVRSARSARSSISRASRSEPPPIRESPTDLSRSDSAVFDNQPPPSPVSTSVLKGGNHDVSAAQASGEVDHVSDQPPSANASINTHMLSPGQPILMKREGIANIVPKLPSADSAGKTEPNTNMAMADIKDIDLDDFIKRLLDAGYAGKVTKSACLKNAEIVAICQRAREVFLSQPALLELDAPVKIVGDVHGQYTDLIRMFEMCGFPPTANYLFLGDYVDRGKQSLETILLLLCYKLKFPENFFLLRGNHECANVTRVYGFYDECKRRCNVKIWKTFVDCFNTLPIAAIVAGKIFCVHGGLSPALSHMDDIRNIARPTDVPDYGLLNDLLWSDPGEVESDWEANERGVSYCFGKRVITNFLALHDFDLICRAHMVVEDGYEFFYDRVLVTVFSAPNYCGEFDNWGAVMSVSGELLCSFELLKPLDSSALKSHIKKGRNKRQQMLNSPPANVQPQSV